MSYIKIENNIVTQKQPNNQDGFINVSDKISSGMIHDGSEKFNIDNFSTPEVDVDYAGLLKKIRDAKIYGGVVFNGIAIDTDLASITAMSKASDRARLDADFIVEWKISGTLTPIDSSTIIAIDDFIYNEGQKAFKAESLVDLSSVTNVKDLQDKFDDAYNSL